MKIKLIKKLVEIIKTLPKNIHVEFKGQLLQNEIDIELVNADLFVSTSLNENYGHSIVESLSFGLPVLISKFCPWNNLDKYQAGFKLPLDRENLKKSSYFFIK